jgi:hypothetical protein
MAIDLLTLDELKDRLGVDPTDSRNDALYSAAITEASQAILSFTERDFGSPTVTEQRTFEYDGSGYLDIDDCTAISAVSVAVPGYTDYVVDPLTWTAMPFIRADAPVHYYILMPEIFPYGVNVALGFERNLDTFVLDHGVPRLPQTAKVTATWGWPEVPPDVKRAAVWTVADWTANPKQDSNLVSEGIAGYTRSWANVLSMMQALAIPNRARDLLVAYQRERV